MSDHDDEKALARWATNLIHCDVPTLMRAAAHVLEAQMVALLPVATPSNRAFLHHTNVPLARELCRRADELEHISPEPRGRA